MARGFESKDVEFQQAEVERTRESRHMLTAAHRQAEDRRRTLELSLARMRADLQTATAPAYRRTLEQAIAALGVALDVAPDVALGDVLDDVRDGALAVAFHAIPVDRLSGRIPQ